MHPCLELEEILLLICREIAGNADTKLFRNTLLSFACSRKIFSPPALARLWEEIDDLGPLVLLLPTSINPDKIQENLANDPDVLKYTTWLAQDLPEYVFHSTIEQEHWKRLDRYTRYVRRLILTTRGFDRLLGESDQEKFTNALNTRGAPLLPNLSHLSILASPAYVDEFPSPRLLIPLVGTMLRSLTLSGRVPSTMSLPGAYPSLVSALSVKYSQIQDLLLDLDDLPYPVDALLPISVGSVYLALGYSYALSRFARIQSLTLPCLLGGMLAPLATLTHLTRLRIGNTPINDYEGAANGSVLPRCSIPTLRVLELKPVDLRTATAIFSMFTGLPNLCHLIVPANEQSGEGKWPSFIEQVERLFADATDATLLLTWDYHRIGDSTMRSGTFPNEAFDFMHTRATTAPMHITCSGNVPSSITHSLAEDIAHGRWTHLRTLRFETRMDSLSSTQLDVPPNLLNLDHLRLLVESCPSLEDLLTPVRALWVPPTTAEAALEHRGTNPSQTRSGLRLIVVGWYSPIVQINGVAEYLSAILPQLRLTLDTVPRCVRDRESLGYDFVDRALGWNSGWDEVTTVLNRAKTR